MGIVQRHVTEEVLRHTSGDPTRQLSMNQLPIQGLTTTRSANSPITDSAAAGTALSCGIKTKNGKIGVRPDNTRASTIAEEAKQAGMRVGIVTSVSIDHATPAVFYAHEPSRHNYYEIACSLSESQFDYFGGGQAKGALDSVRKGRPSPVALAREKGYHVFDSLDALRSASPGTKVWAYSPVVDGAAALPYEMDKEAGAIPLVEFVREGIRLLDNPAGFFLMVEGGKIDWACHVNDPMATVTETLAFDGTIALAVEFLRAHPTETLIVVTADHECGGMTFGRTFTAYGFNPEPITKQPVSYDKLVPIAQRMRKDDTPFFDASQELRSFMGFGVLNKWENDVLKKGLEMTKTAPEARSVELQDIQDFGGKEPLAEACLRIVSARAGIAWGSFTHNGTPVQTSAAGVGAERFSGLYDNTDICNRMRDIMGLTRAE
jgi:alkaline phosphatase